MLTENGLLEEEDEKQHRCLQSECAYYRRRCFDCTATKSSYSLKFSDRCLFMLSLYFLQLRTEDFYEYKKVITWH